MTTTHNWERLAADRWPNALIHGLGSFALRSERGEVYLYPLESQAKMSAPFHNSKVFDLLPLDFSRIPDLMDADERRKERRANQ